IRARLVVGADGARSTVARLVGARRCHLAPGERFAYWGYYEGAAPQPTPTMHLHRSGEEFVLACPTDAGLLLVIAAVPLHRERAFLADVEASYESYVRAFPPVAAMVEPATRIQPLARMRRWTGFFRQSVGPGWVLVGDA